MEYNVFHELPKKDKGLLLLPVGLYYNRDIQKAQRGDSIVFLGGERRVVVRTTFLALTWQATDVLCSYIYGVGLRIVFEQWLTNAVIEGNGKLAVSKNKCFLIWYAEEKRLR